MSRTLWPHGDPSAVARAILARSEYHVKTAPDGLGPLARLIQHFSEWLSGIFRGALGGVGRTAADVVTAGVAVFAFALLLLAAYTVVSRLVGAPRSASDGAREWLDAGVDVPGALAAEAAAAAQAGAFARAISLLYRDALALLHVAGAVEYDRARTAGAYRRAIRRAAPAAAQDFDTLAAAFVTAAFGAAVLGQSDYDEALHAHGALRGVLVVLAAA